jgi:methyl-accepting chemotaxis protein
MDAPHNYKRKIFIINKKYQFRYLFIIISTMLISMASVYFTVFYVIWNKVIDEFFFVPEASKKLADIFVQTSQLLVIPVILLAVIFTFAGIILSHRVAGPIFRVERVANELAKGNLDIKIKFRKGDELHELADSLNDMIMGIRSIVKEDKDITEKLIKISDKLGEDINKDKGLKKDVRDAVDELKVIVGKLKESTDKFII